MNARTTAMALLTVIIGATAILLIAEPASRATPASVDVPTAMDASATSTHDASASVLGTTTYDASVLKGPAESYDGGKGTTTTSYEAGK